MVKNTAGQTIGAQLVSASDGSAFTAAVTAYVTIDAGTQAAGSVGSGACTHEGNGYHTYAPAQAETNGTLIAFTFIGTGAVPATVQVFTTGYDPTAAQIPANVTQISGDATAADNLEAATDGGSYNIGGGAVVAASVTGAVGSVTGAVGSVTGAVGSVTGNVGGNVTGSVGSLATQAKADVNAEVDAALADYDAPTKAELDAAVAPLALEATLGTPAGASVSADIAALPTGVENADALMTRASSNWEASAPVLSLGTAVMKATHKVAPTGADLIIYRSDGTTPHAEQVLTTDATLEPIKEVGGATAP